MIDVLKFEKIKKENLFIPLGESVYQFLYEEIIHLYIPPGMKLNESKIAEQLDISRTPVRSALNRLADENLIQKKDGKVLVVSPMRKEESRSLYEARIAVEGHAAFLAASKISKRELTKLKQLAEDYQEAGTGMDAVQSAELDHEFHFVIMEAAQNNYLKRMYYTIESRLRHYRYCLRDQIPGERLRPILNTAARHHEAIFHALRLGFTDVARKEAERDIEGMLDIFYEWYE